MLDENRVLVPSDLETLILLYGSKDAAARTIPHSSSIERERTSRLLQKCYEWSQYLSRGSPSKRQQDIVRIKRASADVLQTRLAAILRRQFYTLFVNTFQRGYSRLGARVRSLGNTMENSLTRYLNPTPLEEQRSVTHSRSSSRPAAHLRHA